MHSGSDSTESQKYTQWAMNPAAYQNTANDQVDWAALAQQWIIMKEAGPPPIPGEQQVDLNKKLKINSEEGGVAEMDVDMDKEDSIAWNPPPPDIAPPPPGAEAWTNWNSSGAQNWNWSNSWNPPSAVPPPPGIPPVKTPLLPTPNNVYSIAPPDAGSDNAVPYGGKSYNSATSASNNYNTPAFWTGMAVGKITQTEIKPHNKRYSKVNVPTKVTIITPAAGPLVPPVPETPVVVPTVPAPTLDANKRKQLPAWIREGLEKMERDKQKQLEKEKEKEARETYAQKSKLEEKETLEILKNTLKEKDMMRRSRFDSDNEESDNDKPIRKLSPPPPVPLTQEELMMKVRKTMTEILLKVTTQHIDQICREERQRYIRKRRATDQLASAPSGATISARLGLGVYNDDSSSNDESDGEVKRNEKPDSDTELRESIRKRQAAFSKTEQEIEDRLAEADRKKEPSPSRSRSRSSSSESNDNESQVDANTQESRRTYSGSEKSPRRKDQSLDDSSNSSNYLESKSKSRRDSSSSGDSNHESSREKSRSRSPTPESSRRISNASRYSRSPERSQRSRSVSKSSRRDRSTENSSRRESTDSKKRSKRSRSDSPYSRRSKKSRSRSRSSYSSRISSKRSRYSSRRSRSRSRSRDRKHSSKKSSRRSHSRSRDLRRKRSSRRSNSRSYSKSERSKRRSRSRSHRKSRSERSPARRRKSSRSSSRGKRSHRR